MYENLLDIGLWGCGYNRGVGGVGCVGEVVVVSGGRGGVGNGAGEREERKIPTDP